MAHSTPNTANYTVRDITAANQNAPKATQIVVEQTEMLTTEAQ